MLQKSGITGFDNLLYGGVIKNSTILLEGVPGAGKTTFGLEFIYKGIMEMNEPGIVVTFEELPEQLYGDALNFGWDLRKLEIQNKLRIICTSPEVVLDNTMGFLEGIVEEISARRLLLDSISQINMELDNSPDLRKAVYSLCSGIKRMGLSSILIKEVDDYGRLKTSFEEYLVDVVIRLYFEESYRFRKRYIEILKSRGQDFISGKYPFRFDDNGLRIVGVSNMQPLVMEESEAYSGRLGTGIDGLDNILGGGFPKSASIMVSGSSGTGKTVIGFHYLIEGVKQGENGLLLATEESTPVIKKYMDSFVGQDGRPWCSQGVAIIERAFASPSIEEIISDLMDRVRTGAVQRVVVDFINTFMEFSDNLLILKALLRDLLHNLHIMGCTSLLIINEDDAGPISPLKSVIQPLVQGEIHLSSRVEDGRLYRSLEICKMKGQKYISGEHLAEIDSYGMAVFQRLGGV